jgi:hypothetical protein
VGLPFRSYFWSIRDGRSDAEEQIPSRGRSAKAKLSAVPERSFRLAERDPLELASHKSPLYALPISHVRARYAAAGNVGRLNSENTAKSRDLAASYLNSAVLLQTQERSRKWFEDHRAKTQTA